MILKICLFLLKSCNACLFFTSSMSTFQVNSDLLLYSHAMELSFRSFMCMVDAEILEITATNFHYGNCVAEVNTEKLILLRQKPRQLQTAEVNYED